jgi:hypothetical protein
LLRQVLFPLLPIVLVSSRGTGFIVSDVADSLAVLDDDLNVFLEVVGDALAAVLGVVLLGGSTVGVGVVGPVVALGLGLPLYLFLGRLGTLLLALFVSSRLLPLVESLTQF